MAAGAPVFARDTAQAREVLGDCAVYVEPDPDQIALAIDNVLRFPSFQENLSARAKRRAQEAYGWYGWDRVCAQYERALSELAGGGRNPSSPLDPEKETSAA